MGNKITVLVDNESWIVPYAITLVEEFLKMGFDAELIREHQFIEKGWINFMLGCIKIMPEEYLNKNEHNLVVHESALPKGKGFAPMAWQILEGKNEIPIYLIEATKYVDAGKIWLKDIITLDGTELSNEWRNLQGIKTIELCMGFVTNYQNLNSEEQVGEENFYKKRNPEDSELDVNVSIKEQFDLLRIVDNKDYPAFFRINGQKYFLKIEK